MMTYKGTSEQLNNALRETERRGGQVGAIAGAAADEIERQKDRIEALEVAGMNGQQSVSYLAEQLQELRVMYGVALEREKDLLAALRPELDDIPKGPHHD